MRRHAIRALALACLLSLAACSAGTDTRKPAGVAQPHAPYLGLAAVSARQLPPSAAQLGRRPNLVEVYRTFGEPFSAAHAPQIMAYGALPLIQLNPYRTSLSAIAAGRDDGYLRRFAAGIRHLRYPVAIAFAAEANGSWWPWSCSHASGTVFIAAWRHIHDVMTPASGNRIIWVWDVNRVFPGSCPLAALWPGAGYVTWVGVDGYWRSPGDTFATALAPTIIEVRGFTSKPILIAETGAPKGPAAPGWIQSLFTGAEVTPGVIGVVWFDHQSAHGDYRLEDDPAALAMFRREARSYGASPRNVDPRP